MGWLPNSVQELLVQAFLIVLGLGVIYLRGYLAKRAKQLEDHSKSELLDAWIRRAHTIADSTVLALEGSVAKNLREAVKDGQVTREELARVGQQAAVDIRKHLGEEGARVLLEGIGDVDDFLKDLVESKVEAMKKSDTRKMVEALANPPSPSPGPSEPSLPA